MPSGRSSKPLRADSRNWNRCIWKSGRPKEYRQQQARTLDEIERYGTADGRYMEAGIRLLELTRNMHRLFEKQQAAEKRRLLDFVVSNSVWREGKIVPVWRQPFDMIAVANESQEAATAGSGPENGLNRNWLPFVGNYRTFLNSPSIDHSGLFGVAVDF